MWCFCLIVILIDQFTFDLVERMLASIQCLGLSERYGSLHLAQQEPVAITTVFEVIFVLLSFFQEHFQNWKSFSPKYGSADWKTQANSSVWVLNNLFLFVWGDLVVKMILLSIGFWQYRKLTADKALATSKEWEQTRGLPPNHNLLYAQMVFFAIGSFSALMSPYLGLLCVAAIAILTAYQVLMIHLKTALISHHQSHADRLLPAASIAMSFLVLGFQALLMIPLDNSKFGSRFGVATGVWILAVVLQRVMVSKLAIQQVAPDDEIKSEETNPIPTITHVEELAIKELGLDAPEP